MKNPKANNENDFNWRNGQQLNEKIFYYCGDEPPDYDEEDEYILDQIWERLAREKEKQKAARE